MKMVKEEGDFGLMTWRLMSREDQTEVWAMPVMGLGVYLRTIIGGQREDPILLKNLLMIELIGRDTNSPQLVDAQGQDPEPVFRCLNRELLTVEMAKKRFMPKGNKPHPQGLEVYAGALLTQESVPRVQQPPPEIMKQIVDAQQKQAQNEPPAEVGP